MVSINLGTRRRVLLIRRFIICSTIYGLLHYKRKELEMHYKSHLQVPKSDPLNIVNNLTLRIKDFNNSLCDNYLEIQMHFSRCQLI